MKWLESLREDRPISFFIGLAGMVATLLITVLMLIPATPFLRAVGITKLQGRAHAVVTALQWDIVEAFHRKQEQGVASAFHYGNVVGIDEKGRLLFSQPKGILFVERPYQLASIEVIDTTRAQQILAPLRSEPARVSVAASSPDSDGWAIIKIADNTINQILVEEGVARPISVPESDVEFKVFSTYYWRIAKGVTQ